MADERLDDNGRSKLLGLLPAGDPRGQVTTAWHRQEAVRQLYAHTDPALALQWVVRVGHALQDRYCRPRSRARPHPHPVKDPVAPGTTPTWQVPYGGVNNSDQADKARRLRILSVPPVPDPYTALLRMAGLVPTHRRITPR